MIVNLLRSGGFCTNQVFPVKHELYESLNETFYWGNSKIYREHLTRHGITNYLKMDVFVFGFQTFKEFECIFSFITTWKVPVFGVCLVRIFSYSLQLPERTDQKNSEYGHLQCVALLWICDNEIFTLGFTHFTLKIHSKII